MNKQRSRLACQIIGTFSTACLASASVLYVEQNTRRLQWQHQQPQQDTQAQHNDQVS